MAQSHVVSGLLAKRSELAGLVEHHQAELRRLTDKLAHLDATIKLFDPAIDLRTIRSRAVRKRAEEGFGPGETSRLVLETMRENGGRATTRQVAEVILARKGMDATAANIDRVQKRVTAYLRRLESRGQSRVLETDRHGGNLWELTLAG